MESEKLTSKGDNETYKRGAERIHIHIRQYPSKSRQSGPWGTRGSEQRVLRIAAASWAFEFGQDDVGDT